jgi:hypothetical protein
MARLAGSFLLRFWCTTRSQRIEIEHIQSGEKGLAVTVAEAVDWINTRAGDMPIETPEQASQTLDSTPEGDERNTVAPK